MSIISDSMLRNNDSDRASAQYASSQPYSQTYSDKGSSNDNQQGLLERIFNGLGAASDWTSNNVEYVENSPVGQWIGNNVEYVENSPVGQAVSQTLGQALAPANSIFQNWPALLGLAANAAVTPQDNDTFSGSLYNAGVSGAANTVGNIADLMHKDDLAATMYALANKTQDNAPVQADLDWNYITNPHGLTRSFGNTIGSMAPLLPAAALAPESLVAAAGRLSPWLANGVRYGFTAIPEAMAEGGQTRREAIEEGIDHPDLRAFGTVAKNLPLLAVSNTLEGAILGGGLGKALAGKAGEGVFSRVAKAPFRATPSALAEGLQNGLEEGLQQGIQNASVDKEHGYLPWNWTDDQWDAAKEGFFGTLPLGGIGGARKAIFPGVGDVDAATENGPDNTDPVVVAQLTGTTGGAKAGAGANVMDAAQDFMGQHMENGANGCVEAVTKIGARYNPFLADELSKGVVNVDTLVSDAGDKVVPFDPNNLEAGDVIVYGDNDHVVLADGNGGYVGNSSSQQKVVHGGDYNNMGDLKPTKIIKTGSDAASSADSGQGSADLSGLAGGGIASAIAQRTGLPANLIWAQLAHESDDFSSQLAREDHNYGGITNSDGGYRHFDSDDDFINFMVDYYPKYKENGLYDARNADEWASALKDGGYFTADLGEYEGGMKRHLADAGLPDGAMSDDNMKGEAASVVIPDLDTLLGNAEAGDDFTKGFYQGAADYILNTAVDEDAISAVSQMTNRKGDFKNTKENRLALATKFADELAEYYDTLSAKLAQNAPQAVGQSASAPQAAGQPASAPQVQSAARTAETPHIEKAETPAIDKAKAQQNMRTNTSFRMEDAPQEAAPQAGQAGAQEMQIARSLAPKMQQAIFRTARNIAVGMQARGQENTQDFTLLRDAIQRRDYGAMMQMYPQEMQSAVAPIVQRSMEELSAKPQEPVQTGKPAAQIAQGRNLIQLAQQNHISLPSGMVRYLNAGHQKAIDAAEERLQQAGVPVAEMKGVAENETSQYTESQAAPRSEAAGHPYQNAESGKGRADAEESEVAPSPHFDTSDFQHTKTGEMIPAAKATERTSNEDFASLKSIAKQNGGYYNRFAKRFLFKDGAGRDAFAQAAEREVFGRSQPLVADHVETAVPVDAAAQEQRATQTSLQEQAYGKREAAEPEGKQLAEIIQKHPEQADAYRVALAGAPDYHGFLDDLRPGVIRQIRSVLEAAGSPFGAGKGSMSVKRLMESLARSPYTKESTKETSSGAVQYMLNGNRVPKAAYRYYQHLKSIGYSEAQDSNKKAADEGGRTKEVTHESTQSKNQQKPDEGTKNQDQHAKPEPRKAADTQHEAEEGKVSTDRKAFIDGLRDKLKDSYNETLNETFEHNGKAVTRGGFIEDMVKRGEPLKSRQNKRPTYRIFSLDGHDLSPVEYSYYDYLTVKDKSTPELAKKTMLPGSADWIAAHPFHYDKSKTVEENSAEATRIAKVYRKVFGETVAINTPERKILRRRIIEELYGKGAEKKEHKAFIVIGLPASGKSSAVAEPLAKKYGALIIDSDEAKERLPEFTDGLLADAVHEESSNIADDVRTNAIGNGDNIVLPMVGRTESKLHNLITMLKNNGYEVNLHYVDLPVNKAVERGKARFSETGRNVPLDYIRSVGLNPKHNFDKLKVDKEVDSYGEWSNDVDRGQRPRLLEERPAGLYSESELAGRGQRVLLKDGKVGEDSEQNQKAQGRGKDSTGKVTSKANRSGKQGGFSVSESSPIGEPIHGIKGAETTVITDSGKEIRTQEESDTTSDIQNANAASTEDSSVETNPRVLSYKRKAQEIVSSFEKRKVNLTDARQEIKDLMAKANEERWGQKMSNDECMAAQGFLSDALSKLNAKQAKKRKARKSIAKAKAEEKSNESIFGSVEDADQEEAGSTKAAVSDIVKRTADSEAVRNAAENADEQELRSEIAAQLKEVVTQRMVDAVQDGGGSLKSMKVIHDRYHDDLAFRKQLEDSVFDTVKDANKKDAPIFGSVEDADREMLDALGLSEEDLNEEVLEAPEGISNTAEERERLEKELSAELHKMSAMPMFNQKIYTLGLKLAMTYVKDGINTVKKLVAKLNATFGDKIGPWAPALAETVRTWPKGVPFDEKKVMAISKAVGARYEGGITTLDDMQADMKKLLKGQHKSFAPMIEASYNGIKKFFDEKEAQSHGDESRQEKSESTDAGREGQQSATAEGAGEGRTESRNVSGAEGGESKISRGRDSGSAERENPERTEPSGVRAGTELEETAGNGTRKRGTEKPVLTEAQKNPSPEETPGHDYEIKPSKTKKTPAVRFKQNIAAIKLLKQLEAENRMPTPKEQAVLGNYNGWGGLKDAFLDTKEDKELRAVLTPEEYEAAKSTINDAFYTPADIVQAVWKGVSRLGFNGGRILDPSMGTGNFFGCMPRDMMKKSSLRGIEIDDLTSRFARMLYPSALVEHTGFEKASLADNFYDLVISNIPFDANHSIAGYKIHNYFFARGMDKVRPGGLMVYITSQGSLTNSQDGARMREYIGKKADMVAAYKLPSGAFGESGTNVGTDIAIFRKRGENEMKPSYAQDFQHLTKMFTQTNWSGDTYGGVTVNKYFKDHPENIIGKASSGRDQYGNDVMQVKPSEGANIAKDLAKAMNKLPKDIYKPINRTGKGPFDTIKANFKARADEKTHDFEYYEKDGKVYQNQDGTAVEVGAGNKLKLLKGYLKVKNALNSLTLAEMDPNAKESTVDKLRKQLNTAYDAFVKQNGYLNDPTVQRAYIDDPSSGMVMALEKVTYTGFGAKKKIEKAEKTAIFKERTISPIKEVTSVDSPNDALLVSLRNKGRVDLPYMAKLMGSTPEEIVAGLDGHIFKNPATERYETRDEYLSGNVREKLAQAENAATQDPSYQKNADALRKVVPKDLIPDEICVTMGAPWIPASDVQAFADHITGRAGSLSVKFIPSNAKWVVDGYGRSGKYETRGIDLATLLSHILNNKAIEIYSGRGEERALDREATDAANVVAAGMKDDFRAWLWSDKTHAKRLARYYNDNYNNTVLREYDGSHLTFPGHNEKIELKPHQKNVVWRMLQGGNTLIAHCVGAGKTFEMQAAGMEMRRLGIANKPLYILPNNVVEQFTKEFRQLYPDANLLVLQNDYKSRPGYIPAVPKSTVEQTIKREDGRKETITIPIGKLSAADRKKVLEARAMRTRTLTQIRTGDWDGIIMSHSQFERLPLSPETAGSIIREQLDEVEQAIVEAKNGNVGKKDLSTIENQKKKLEDKLKDILKTDLRDIGIPFEQLGVDQIFVDEADMFKNLHYTTSMDRVNGLPNSNANRSMDMYAKTRWLTNANNGRGVVFATGTPVSNTMAEMYTMMRYLDFRGLKEKGLNLFDNWLRTFGEIGSGIERNPSGNGFRKVNKVLRFINMPELTKMFRKFADVKTQDDLDLDIPKLKNGKPTIVKIAPDPVLTNYIKKEVPRRIANMAKRREDMRKGADNMLALTGDLRKMSITDSKIDALADEVAKKYEETTDVKGAQLIFCDQGIPKAENDNAKESDTESDDGTETENASVYGKIIEALEERGVPKEQIVFIQSAKNKAQMEEIFQKVDNGDIRILIGSTQKMGAGTNCQHHLVALHDLDAPWRPRDLEQRHGRILRQGNPNKEVEIFNYVLQDSFDAVMWEKLKNKAAIVAQAMSNNMQQRTVEDADLVTLTYADAENAGTSDPLVKERITLDSEIKKYKHAQVAFNRKVSTAEATLETAPKEIDLLKSAIEKIKGDIAARQDTSGDNFRMTISGKEYVERKAAQEELGKVLARLSSKTSVKIGEIGGFDVKAYVSGDGEAHIQLVRGRAYMANTATVRGVESALHKAPETMLKAREIELSRNENNLKEAKEIVGQKNPYAEKLANMEKRFKEINRQIEDNLLGNAKKEETEAPNEETSYSAEEESDAQERALSDIKQEVASAFPNAKNVRDNGHEVFFSMPNGAEVSVSIVPSIEVTEREERNARAAHGLSPEVHVKINGKERTVGSKAIIELSQLGRKGSAYHEVLHAVYDLCLTEKEKAALHRAFDKEAKAQGRDVYEVMADKYRDWILARQQGRGTRFGKLWQKVKDAAVRLARVVRGADNAGDVFRKVASGEAWERPYNEVESDTRYAAEQKGAQSFIKAAASKLGKRMGVKSDKIITEEAKAKEGIGILDYLIASPSRVATRVKSFRQFYRMGVRAMDVLTERRSYYQRKLGKAMKLVKSKNDYEELTDILLSGDAEGKEWTKEELIQSGTKENVAEAYTRIRRLMRQAYKMVNEAHKHPKTYSKRLSNSKIEELRQNPFVKIMKIHDEEDDGRRLVTYREFANYEHTLEGVTKQALDEMHIDEDVQVLEATKQADGTYKVRVREGRGDVTNRKGYIPHFFHNYMVEVRDEDGDYVTTITSGRTQREAVKKAEEWMKDNKLEDGQKIYIHPKIFDFTRYGMSEKGIVQLGDKDFYALMNRVAKDNDMSLEEAKDLLQNVHQKNRHRFFGNVLHRKGVSGFETDMNYVLSHYFNSASRYYAMETEFKPQAISLYERLFGDFAKDSKSSLAQYVKDYINDVNGTPSALERGVNDALMRSKVYRDFVVSHYGERAVLQLSSNIAGATTYMCLGYFNVSSALLNLTQVMNSAAYIGDVSALGKCLSKGMHRKYSLHDLKVLKETNVLNDIGLDSGSGYDVNRMSAKSLLGKINKAGMSFFKVSEQTVRIGTVLAAYESGIKRGMSHEEAIDFAKEVNQKSNFNYSVADAPNIFRRGSFLSQLALQFKKYGIKELEVMADMCSSRTSHKQKLIFWGTYLLAAGLCGLPALDWLDEVLGWVFGKSPKLAAQEAIMEATGGTPVGKFIGRMAMYGLPSSLVGVDLSSRVGLSDVVPTELKNFLPPLATKIPQFMQDIFSEAKINAVRDFSPAIYNQIAAWGTGKSYDKRGRINAEYNTFYDKLLRSIGFKSTDERVDSDIRRITSERRSELTKKKQEAVDAYIAHPTPQNMKKLKDLGVKDSTVEKERERKKEDSYNRTKGGMTKKEAQENQQLLNFK